MKKIRKELSILEFKKGTIIELNKMKTIIGIRQILFIQKIF